MMWTVLFVICMTFYSSSAISSRKLDCNAFMTVLQQRDSNNKYIQMFLTDAIDVLNVFKMGIEQEITLMLFISECYHIFRSKNKGVGYRTCQGGKQSIYFEDGGLSLARHVP